MDTTYAASRVQALDTLREIVRRVESDAMEITNMTLTIEPDETRSFRDINGRLDKQMVVRRGDMRVELKLSSSGTTRSEPRAENSIPPGGYATDNGTIVGPNFLVGKGKMFSDMSREELMQFAEMTREARERVAAALNEEAAAKPDPTFQKRPPLTNGARILDID